MFIKSIRLSLMVVLSFLFLPASATTVGAYFKFINKTGQKIDVNLKSQNEYCLKGANQGIYKINGNYLNSPNAFNFNFKDSLDNNEVFSAGFQIETGNTEFTKSYCDALLVTYKNTTGVENIRSCHIGLTTAVHEKMWQPRVAQRGNGERDFKDSTNQCSVSIRNDSVDFKGDTLRYSITIDK